MRGEDHDPLLWFACLTYTSTLAQGANTGCLGDLDLMMRVNLRLASSRL